MKRTMGALLVAAILTGCASTGSEREPEPAPEVDWSRYAPQVESRIEDLASKGDCDGLQREFDTADANDDAMRKRTGEGTADLLDYLDAEMQAADCY